MGKAPTIKDVARRAGVSVATASNVVNGNRPVGEASRRKVTEAIAALDYRLDPLASVLRSGDARIVAIVVPDLDNPFFTAIISSVEQCVGQDRYQVIVASSRGEGLVERAKLKAVLAWRPAGLIVIPCADDFPNRDIVEASQTPYVIADRGAGPLPSDMVSIDNEEAGAIGAAHLIELGHRNILVAASTLQLANMSERCMGAVKALRSRGLPEPAIVELGATTAVGSVRLSAWFATNAAPTAVQALTNFTTLCVLTIAANRGLRIPQDVSLVGFDDYPWMSARMTPLTAVYQPEPEIGRVAWKRLSARIKGDRSSPVHIRLPCELRVRASTAAPNVQPTKPRGTKELRRAGPSASG